jgi:hypothetical protein
VPTVTICSSQFQYLAETEAKIRGVPWLPLLVLPHPFAGRSEAELESRASAVLPDVIRLFTQSSPEMKTDALTVAEDDQRPSTVMDNRHEGEHLEVSGDPEDAWSAFEVRGWGDGLPIIPPTPERLDRFLAAASGDPDEVIAVIPPRNGMATRRTIAINAVMAGCLPEHVPIVVAALRAVVRPPFLLWTIQTTTNPVAPMITVSGPGAQRVGLNSGYNALGQGWRANMTIGRCLRLLLTNVGGGTPGGVDRASHGQPGKLSMCFAEDSAGSPWRPYHVRRGLDPSTTAVTVFAAGPPHNVLDTGCTHPDETLALLGDAICAAGSNNFYWGGEPLIILNAERARFLGSIGYTLENIQEQLYARARIPQGSYSGGAIEILRLMRDNDPAWSDGSDLTAAASPGSIQLVVAGGAGRHCVFVPTFFAIPAITEVVES